MVYYIVNDPMHWTAAGEFLLLNRKVAPSQLTKPAHYDWSSHLNHSIYAGSSTWNISSLPLAQN